MSGPAICAVVVTRDRPTALKRDHDAHNAVMRMHRDATHSIPNGACSDRALLNAARCISMLAGQAGGA